MSRRRLVSVPVSLALHGLLLVVVVLALRPRQEPSLFVDLTHGWIAAGDAGADRGPAAGGALAAGPARAARVTRSRPGSMPRVAASADDVPRAAPPAAAPAAPPVSEAPAAAAPAVASPSTAASAPAPPTTGMPPVSPRSAAAERPPAGVASGVAAPALDGEAGGRRTAAGGLSVFPAAGEAGGRERGAGARGGAGATGRGDVGGDDGPGAAGGAAGAAGAQQARALPEEAPGEAGDYAPYLALLRQRIQESLRYPAAARRRGLSGTVKVEIEVAPSGTIARAAVVGSSAYSILDEAALDAVRALPRVPFPAGVRPRPLRARLPVVFELR